MIVQRNDNSIHMEGNIIRKPNDSHWTSFDNFNYVDGKIPQAMHFSTYER